MPGSPVRPVWDGTEEEDSTKHGHLNTSLTPNGDERARHQEREHRTPGIRHQNRMDDHRSQGQEKPAPAAPNLVPEENTDRYSHGKHQPGTVVVQPSITVLVDADVTGTSGRDH